MARHRKRAPPRRGSPQAAGPGLPPLGVLEEFSQASLSQWRAAGRNLHQYSQVLFFDLEKHRAAHSDELVSAIRSSTAGPASFKGWVRLVDWRYTTQPLSMEGSVRTDGGRFNIGRQLNTATYTAFPALYLAEDFPTAYRERFGIDREAGTRGLTADDLTLNRGSSFSNVTVDVHLESYIDIGDLNALKACADVLRRFKMPKSVGSLARSLRLTLPGLVRSPGGLQRQLLNPNWRVEPVQYGLPSNPQIFGRLCEAAGVHGILYPSVRDGTRSCLALFPQNWKGSVSRVEVIGPVPPEVTVTSLGSHAGT